MDPNRKSQLFKKLRRFAKLAGKMSGVSAEAAQKRQQQEEDKNILNTAIEKGIAYEKFVNAVQRKVKTETDAKMILQNIQDYEAVNKLFGKDTEQIAKLTLCKGMSLEVFQKAQPIIKQNEPSNNKFYIIAKGSVAILKATDTNVFQVVLPKKEEPIILTEQDEVDEDDKTISDLHQSGNTSGQLLGARKSRVSADRRKSSINQMKRGSQLSGQEPRRESKFIQIDPKEIEKQLWIQETEKYGKEVNQLYIGQGFGEAAIMEADPKRAKRGATILAREDNTTLLIIVKRDFQKFKDSFSSQGKEKAAILSQLIPQLKLINSTQTRNDLIFYFQEEGGLRGQALTVEDKIGEKIFVLKEGQVQIEKNYINIKNIYYKDVQKLKIAAVGDYSFLGEELLLGGDDSKYSYTITVSSIQARYYSIKKSILQQKFPNIIKDILNEYELKEAHRISSVQYILSKDSQPTNMIQVDDTLHEFNKLKNCELFSQMKNTMVESHNKKIFKDVVAKEKEQTPENLAQFRSNVMRQLEEKQEPIKQRDSFASNYGLESNFNNNSNSNLGSSNKHRRPLTSSAYLGRSKLENNNNNNSYTKNHSQIDKIPQQSTVLQSERLSQIIQQSPSVEGQLLLKPNNANLIAGDQQVQLSHQQPNSQQQQPSQLISQSQQLQQLQAGSQSARVGSAVYSSRQKVNFTESNEQFKQGTHNFNNPLACDPVYSKLYQQQHDLESNFMENLAEKIKIMSKATSQVPIDGPQLDLGYLEQFKKKQQLKLMVSAKAKLNQAAHNSHRFELIQKTIDKIKVKYAKDNTIEMEIAISDNPPMQITNQNAVNPSTKIDTQGSNKTEISEMSFPIPNISANHKAYRQKTLMQQPYKANPPLSGKNRLSNKNQDFQQFQRYSQSVAMLTVPMSPRWKALMSSQSPTNLQQQQITSQHLDPNNLQCMSVQSLTPSFTHVSASALQQSVKNWSVLINHPVSYNQDFLNQNPGSPEQNQKRYSKEINLKDNLFQISSPRQQIKIKRKSDNEVFYNVYDNESSPVNNQGGKTNNSQPYQTLQTQARSNTIQSYENFSVVSQPIRLVSAGPQSTQSARVGSSVIRNSTLFAGGVTPRTAEGVFVTDQESFPGNLPNKSGSQSSRGQLPKSNEYRVRCQTASSLLRKSMDRKKLKIGLAFPKNTPYF